MFSLNRNELIIMFVGEYQMAYYDIVFNYFSVKLKQSIELKGNY